MKILNWNIGICDYKKDTISRSERIISSIEKINPDVILFQEASTFFLDYLQKNSEYDNVCTLSTSLGLTCILVKVSLYKNIRNSTSNSDYVMINLNDIKIVNNIPLNYNFDKLQNIFSNFYKNIIIVGNIENKNIERILNFCNIKKYNKIFSDLKIENFNIHTECSGQGKDLPISFNYIFI